MKIRGTAVKLTTFAALALLSCSLFVVAHFHGRRPVAQASRPSFSASSSQTTPAEKAKWLEAYGNLPLSFIENQGQSAQQVRYLSHGSRYDLFLTSDEAVVTLRKVRNFDMSPRHRAKSLKAMRAVRRAATTATALRMQFDGANSAMQVAGEQKLPGVVNYYIGNDPKKWHRNVPTFGQVKYSQVYPGVDLVFYGNQRKLEYDFVVAPGADPNAIRMHLVGAQKLRRNAQGDVVVSVKDGEVELQKPVIYQQVAGRRQEIAGHYILAGDRVSFAVAGYDHNSPLIIDPVLNYSTYIGGSGDDVANAIVVDSSGQAVIAGGTDSTDFPLSGAGTGGMNTSGGTTGFITQLNPTGNGLLVSAYIGGSTDGDEIFGLAMDSSNNVYATGTTFSTDFPTTGTALKPTLSSNDNGTSFLAEANSSGTLFYSTYLGGTNGDFGNSVAADASGNAYVTGVTYSVAGTTDVTFPVQDAIISTLPSSAGSAFLTKINTKGVGTDSLSYSTYLGGDAANATNADLGFGDEGAGVVTDGSGKAYITGTTTSSDFPVSTVHYQAAPKAANVWSSVFLSEIDTTITTGAASLVYSTYIGGSGDSDVGLGDFGTGIALRSTVAYLTGTTNSADFPTTSGAYQTTGDATNGSAYVTLLDTAVGTSLKYSTFLGAGATTGYSIQADPTTGDAVIGGSTASPSFPTTPGAFQTGPAAGSTGDGFISQINPAGAGSADLVYSTYFGGSGTHDSPDQIFGLALGTLPAVYVTGQTFSTNASFPVTAGAVQSSLNGPSDAYVTKLSLIPTLGVSPTSLTFTATAIGTVTAGQSVTLTNNTGAAVTFTSATITNPSPAAAATDFAVSATTCGASIAAGGTCTVTVTFDPSTTSESANLTLTDSDSSSPQTVALTGTAPAPFQVSPSSLTFTSTAVGTATAAQNVTLTNNGSSAVAFTSATVVLTSATGAAADFAQSPATTCGASIAAGSSCTVSITYTPSVATTETATLTLVDGAPSSPQVIALSGSVSAPVPGFTLSTTPGTLTVKKGTAGMVTVNVTPVNGFTGTVALTCTGAPKHSTCGISPASVSPVGAVAATATLTFTTNTKSTAQLLPILPRVPTNTIRVVAPLALALLLVVLFASEQRLRTRLAMTAALLIVVALAGCGSSGTKKGSYTLTVTGTSGSITETVTIPVVVD